MKKSYEFRKTGEMVDYIVSPIFLNITYNIR